MRDLPLTQSLRIGGILEPSSGFFVSDQLIRPMKNTGTPSMDTDTRLPRFLEADALNGSNQVDPIWPDAQLMIWSGLLKSSAVMPRPPKPNPRSDVN